VHDRALHEEASAADIDPRSRVVRFFVLLDAVHMEIQHAQEGSHPTSQPACDEAETAKASGRTAFDEMLRFLSSHTGHGVDSPGVHEPLVSGEVWHRVQDIRTGRGSSNKGYGSKEFTYRGLVRCACGEAMTAEVKKGHYTYYHCTGRKRGVCGRPFLSEDAITEAFARLLENITVPEEFLPWIREG
jgi:hypothetical protein